MTKKELEAEIALANEIKRQMVTELCVEQEDLKEEISYLKNLIATMSYDISYEDGSETDKAIKKVLNTLLKEKTNA